MEKSEIGGLMQCGGKHFYWCLQKHPFCDFYVV